MLSAFTYIPILARDELGADNFYVTVLVGFYAVASFLSSYIFGRAGDIYGRRIVLRLGLLLSTLTFGLIIISNSLEILFIVRILNGFCIGIYPGALAAFAYESDMKMGRFASFGAVGWGVGTIFAGYAAGFGIYWAFVVSTLFFCMAFLSAMALPPIERKAIHVPLFPKETLTKNFSVYGAVLIRHSSAYALWTLWPLFLADLGGAQFLPGDLLIMIGIVQATNSISQVVFMVGITDRFNDVRLIQMGLISSAVTFFWFSFATNILDIIPAQILLGFSWACLYVGSLKFLTDRNEERSTASGLLTSIMSISGVLGPIYAGILITIWPNQYIPIILFAALMSAIGFLFFRHTCKETRLIPKLTVES